jgi:hypothetical protein
MPDSNPFATRFTRPGAIDFIFPDGDSPASLVARMRDAGWHGQIIGPHGSGKSTLLAALTPALQAAGRTVEHFTVHGLQPLKIEPQRMAAWNDKSLVLVDGFEQLSWPARRRLISLVRQRGAGLLVTTHRDLGLFTIFRTQPTEDLARRVVARLLPAGDKTISPADIAQAYAAHGHNLREVLFALFDVYRART